jgi:hypothetical protein
MESKKRKSDVLTLVAECSEDELCDIESEVKKMIGRRKREKTVAEIRKKVEQDGYALELTDVEVEGLESMSVLVYASLMTWDKEDMDVGHVKCTGLSYEQPPWISELGAELGSPDLEIGDLSDRTGGQRRTTGNLETGTTQSATAGPTPSTDSISREARHPESTAFCSRTRQSSTPWILPKQTRT